MTNLVARLLQNFEHEILSHQLQIFSKISSSYDLEKTSTWIQEGGEFEYIQDFMSDDCKTSIESFLSGIIELIEGSQTSTIFLSSATPKTERKCISVLSTNEEFVQAQLDQKSKSETT